ncbi:hypothetical protein [Enterococcus gilvus]|uniref:Uncharacterized protein n=1 Tax=Enterococcus gilvus ATCC BAA-350 TaxID=1158614 RepID=R2XZH4_9ENTE|nr:hypothetical protein [Enterococcus gilvus]EOI55442.1 hypothetical protein UKC_02650 [Enterococcus gilvus ATCC BAA-350]EOW82015.1 hypothetical protein I592_01316 [Enterococcus gilvus ATCC BAA-350]OJG43044.1 hypothetical protein RV02_GL002964 [Enterococcus gilvus]
MNAEKEIEVIYELMQGIIAERRELSQQYYDLKYRLDNLRKDTNIDALIPPSATKAIHKKNPETLLVKVNYPSHTKKNNRVAFERVAGYVREILKASPVPISAKEIYEKLIHDYDLNIQYKNFRNNILPRINESSNFSIEKAYRGYWQYKRGNV